VLQCIHVTKKLTKHGNSLALVIDRPILDLLHIDADTNLEISTDGKSLHIAPALPTQQRARFEAAQSRAHKQFKNAFKKLAQ
jgi:antitoxin MazE